MRGVGAHCRGRLDTLRCSWKVLPCSLPLPFSCISLPSCHSSLHPSLFLSDLRIGYIFPHVFNYVHAPLVLQHTQTTLPMLRTFRFCFSKSSSYTVLLRFFQTLLLSHLHTQPHVLFNPFFCVSTSLHHTDASSVLFIGCNMCLASLTVFLRCCFLIFLLLKILPVPNALASHLSLCVCFSFSSLPCLSAASLLASFFLFVGSSSISSLLFNL